MDQHETNIAKAVRLGGGPSKVSRGLGISQPHAVGKWVELNRVPPFRIIPLEKLIGGQVTREEIDPILYPPK